MKSNDKEENVNQHRRSGLEGLDEVRHRQNWFRKATKRRNGKSPSGVYAKTQVDVFDIPSVELVLFYLYLCAFSWVWTYPWNMISAIFSGSVLAITVIGIIYRWRKARERSKLLKDPFETHFLIPKATQHKVGYYTQDSVYHYLDELTLPPNSEVDVVISLNPRLDVVMTDLQFGCKGDLESKPEPLYYFNWWIERGLGRERHPEKDEGHYVDSNKYYHIVQNGKAWPKGEEMIAGLRIKTKKEGTYPFWVIWVMPNARGERTPLTIHVK